MDSTTAFAAELADPECSVGTVLKSGSPNMAEALGQTEIDFLLIDRQHASPGIETIEHIVRAADLSELPVVVRVPPDSLELVGNVLDAGAAGIMLPQTETVDEVEQMLPKVRYGKGRSFSPTTRAGRFGTVDMDREAVDAGLAVIPQIETQLGLENADAIAALDGVDNLAVGPLDLSISLGVDRGSNDFQTILDDLFDRVRANGCGIGTFVGGPDEINTYRNRATFVACGSDIGLVTAVFS